MGVWIETRYLGVLPKRYSVTPCMGVWIETIMRLVTIASIESHTLYGCVD